MNNLSFLLKSPFFVYCQSLKDMEFLFQKKGFKGGFLGKIFPYDEGG